jgi:hypothetical protein
MAKKDKTYILKHKDADVAEILFDEYYDFDKITKVFDAKHLPIGILDENGNIDQRCAYNWWNLRGIADGRVEKYRRNYLEPIPAKAEFMVKALALSLTDHYWICPVNKSLKWKNVNFYDNDLSSDIGNMLLFKKSTRKKSYSMETPNSTVNGSLKKCWYIIDGKRFLLKENTGYSAFSEVVTSEICKRLGIPAVTYKVKRFERGVVTLTNYCPNMTDGKYEFVPAYQIENIFDRNINVSKYDHYIRCVKSLGYDNIENELDNMIFIDCLIRNKNRHYGNFGLLRDSETLKIKSTAPLFDNGFSLWHDRNPNFIEPTDDCYGKCFYGKNNDQLALIKDFKKFKLDKLSGIGEYYENLQNKHWGLSKAHLEGHKTRGQALDIRVDFFAKTLAKITL